jgi:hypothetical protein
MTPKRKWLAVAVGLVLSVTGWVAADESNQKTIFTFSDSIELPGKTLPAGRYTFRLLDTQGNRNVVQVFNENESDLITTLITVPATRQEPADEAMVTFAERSENAPPAVQYWFYPGRTWGHEFVYPHDQAVKIAKATNKPVLATDTPTGDNEAIAKGHITTVEPNGTDTAYAERTPASEAGTTRSASTMSSTPEQPSSTESAKKQATGGEAETAPSPSATATKPYQPSTSGTAATTSQSGQSATARNQTSTMGDRTSQNTSGQATTTDASGTSARARRLPRTASNEPLLLLIAMSSLIGAIAIARLRRQHA